MSLSLFEIIELADGEIGLCKAGDEGEPLIIIKFSKDYSEYLKSHKVEVVKAMIEAGLETVTELMDDVIESEQDLSELESQTRVLH